jgi:hypothetical protein
VKHRELSVRLDAAASQLTARVLDEMYLNPFWHERFGERADRHGKQDGRFHVDYLIQALHADDPIIMHNYARWLQPVLTTRGMCTRHLDDNVRLLADAIREQAWPDAQPALDMLAAARRALEYPNVPAQTVQRAAASLATQAAASLYSRHPEWEERWPRERCVDDLLYHATYAADAISLRQPALFVAHVEWIAGFLTRRGVPRAHLIESLDALREAARHQLPDATTALDELFEPALAALHRAA